MTWYILVIENGRLLPMDILALKILNDYRYSNFILVTHCVAHTEKYSS